MKVAFQITNDVCELAPLELPQAPQKGDLIKMGGQTGASYEVPAVTWNIDTVSPAWSRPEPSVTLTLRLVKPSSARVVPIRRFRDDEW